MNDNDRVSVVTEENSCLLDDGLKWLKNNHRSDGTKDIKQLWRNTYRSRLEEFLENKKLIKKEFYLSFKCLKSAEGTSLVSTKKM